MKIAVGTQNPVKVAAVMNVVKRVWPGSEIISVKVPSDVSEQPMSDEEAIEGARNRARLALEKTGADLGIGLEGCGVETEYGMFLTGWVVAVDKKGRMGIGCGGRMLLPSKVASEVRKGKELGPVMDAFVGDHNTKQKEGAVGILTRGLIVREEAFHVPLIYALARFYNNEWYE
jgi:inosine/xanthosine triphosphatase